jgi:hypothetical protein
MRNARSPTRTHPRVTIVTRPMWRLRLGRTVPRRLLRTLAMAGVLVGARYALAHEGHGHSRTEALGGGVSHADQQHQQQRFAEPHIPQAKEPRK